MKTTHYITPRSSVLWSPPFVKTRFINPAWKWPLIVGTLIAAEVITILCMRPMMGINTGFLVIAGLSVLPIWASLLSLIDTVNHRGPFLLLLLLITIAAAVVLFVS